MIATGIGSMPADIGFAEATRLVVGHYDQLPHVVELPALGPGADMVGRCGALLSEISSDLSWETTTTGWRRTAAQGRHMRRALSWWGESLDAFEEQIHTASSSIVKTQVCGPWTFAASVESLSGDRILRDAGMVRDICTASTEALLAHALHLRQRTGAQVVVQIDEPSLPAVLAGDIPTSSGLGRIRSIDPVVARTALEQMVSTLKAVDVAVAVHCCAADVPLSLLRESGVGILSIDLSLHARDNDDILGEHIDSGLQVWLGLSDESGTQAPSEHRHMAQPVDRLMDNGIAAVEALRHRLGFNQDQWAASVSVTPACGLAGVELPHARRIMSATRRIADRLSTQDTASMEA
jgi:hypothetical protein